MGDPIIPGRVVDRVTGDISEVPRFRVEGFLGGGGFGEVYKVANLRTGKFYALKTLREDRLTNPDLVEAFKDEIIMWLQLGDHPGLARAYQRFTIEGREFVLVEFVDGANLAELLAKERSLSVPQALDVAVQFADVMIECARRIEGFVHRDVKPSNVMLTRKKLVKLIDLGLAESVGWQTVISQSPARTKSYAPPEVGEGGCNVRSDLFSFGVTLGVLLTGEPPKAVRAGGRTLLAQHSVPEKIIEIFQRCVADRDYEDFVGLKADLLKARTATSGVEAAVTELMLCSSCGYIPSAGAKQCPLCGGELVRRGTVPEFITIPAGGFQRGCSEERARRIAADRNLSPETVKQLTQCGSAKVTLPEFSIAKHPVTNREYLEFVEATGHTPPVHWAPAGPPFPSRLADHPVVNVSFLDAEAYCDWMSQDKGIPVRLPSPDEWEKAAAGEAGLAYPWGNEFDDEMAHDLEIPEGSWEAIRTSPVGEFPTGDSHPSGLQDMAGNVQEWITSFDPHKELRGGSWQDPGEVGGLVVISVASGAPDAVGPAAGFRFVMASTEGDPHEDRSVVGFDLVYIPEAGTFNTGCPPNLQALVGARLEENRYQSDAVLAQHQPRRTRVRAFYILRHPVTNAQYHEFVCATGHRRPKLWSDGDQPYPPERAQHPVTYVSFEDAMAFCAWVGQRLERTVRLPSPAEWELAARGATGTHLYPWGTDTFEPHRCNSREYPATVPVHAFPQGASPYGLYNMCGNVFEIVKDDVNMQIGVRGGSWKVPCSIYGLSFWMPIIATTYTDNDTGFRLVRDD